MRDALEDLLSQVTLLTLAAGIALGYAVLSLAQGLAALVLSAFDDQSSFVDGTLSLAVGGRALQFNQLVVGLIEVAVVLAVILYVVRPDQRNRIGEEADGSE